MELIYLEGDIKPNEYVIIFDNSCRGIKPKCTPPKPLISTIGNTRGSLPEVVKSRLNGLRIKSVENSLGETLEGGGSKRSKRSKKRKRK